MAFAVTPGFIRSLVTPVLLPLLTLFIASSYKTKGLLAYIGARIAVFVLLRFFYNAGQWLFEFFILTRRKIDLEKYSGANYWALVTGASDGIGKEFALQLAENGMNVILAARTASKLQAVETEINKRFPKIKTHVIVVDFSSTDDQAVYRPIEEALRTRTVTVLINNVGIAQANPKDYFVDQAMGEIDAMSRTNIWPQNHLTRMIVPGMIQRKSGLIIFVSSLSAHQRNAVHMAVYGGTKAYNRIFAHNLSTELGVHGIQVQSLCPGPTVSNIAKRVLGEERVKSDPMLTPTDSVVRFSLLHALYKDSRYEDVDCIPAVKHWLLYHVSDLVPKELSRIVFTKMFDKMEGPQPAANATNKGKRE